MQQHVTVWVDSEGVAVSPELDVRDESKCEISAGQHKDVCVCVWAWTRGRAHSVGRRLLFDFIDRHVNSHDSQDELVLQMIRCYLSSERSTSGQSHMLIRVLRMLKHYRCCSPLPPLEGGVAQISGSWMILVFFKNWLLPESFRDQQ